MTYTDEIKKLLLDDNLPLEELKRIEFNLDAYTSGLEAFVHRFPDDKSMKKKMHQAWDLQSELFIRMERECL